jgi:hypothetical protein
LFSLRGTLPAWLVRVLKAALLAACLWPVIAGAIPIFEDRDAFGADISGWTNEHGNFVVAWNEASMVVPSSGAGYSAASSLFSLHTGLFSFSGGGTPWTFRPAEVSIDVIVREDGTIGGDLVGGLATVRAGAGGVPEAGIAGGEVVLGGTYCFCSLSLIRTRRSRVSGTM